MPFQTPETVVTSSGAKISLRHQPPTAVEARAVVLICHGLSEHAGRYEEFAAFLGSRGVHTYAGDHRGHGLTVAEDAEPGRFARYGGADKVIQDIVDLALDIRNRHPRLPLVLFGHSMGGTLALISACRRPELFAGLAVWNANLSNPGAVRAGRLLVKAERFFKGSDVPSAIAPRLTFDGWAKAVGARAGSFDWLNHDRAEVARYEADPLCGRLPSVSLWIDLLGLLIEGGSHASIARLPKTMPVNLVGGGEDPSTDKGEALVWLKRRMEAVGTSRVTLTLYPGMRHETLLEYGRDDAMKAFAAWLDGLHVLDTAS